MATVQTPDLAAPRSAQPRKKGANLEKWGWIYMRASGVILAVLIFGHLFVNLVAGDGVKAIDFAFVAGKLADFAEGGSTVLSVNLPQVAPARTAGYRIVHLHANVPGVLAKINTVLAELGANIVAQTLATRGHVGFAVLDIDKEVAPEVLGALRALPESVRVEAR